MHADQIAVQDGAGEAAAMCRANAAGGGQKARVGAALEILGGKFRRHRGGKLAERLAVFNEGIQVFGGVGIERRGQDAAVAEGARPELHAAMHPGHDAVLGKLRNGRFDGFLGGQDVAEAQLAIF